MKRTSRGTNARTGHSRRRSHSCSLHTRISQPLPRKFALSSARGLSGGFCERDGRTDSQHRWWFLSRGADVANHHCDNGWSSCRLQRVAGGSCTYLPVPCYLYAVKFISRLGHRPPWVLPARLLSIPAHVYMHLTPATRARGREREGSPGRVRERERESGWHRGRR